MTKTERTCTRCGLVFVTAASSDPCPGCVLASIVDDPDTEHGSAFWEDTPPGSELGNNFSHFEVLEEIGRGGMGTVFKARDRVTGRLVALKVLQAHHLAAPDLVERFRSEVRAISSLDHRHILPIHEVGDCDGIPFFSMKLATKGSLAQHLGDYLGKPRLAAQLTTKIARGVQHAHEHGILHRDLKPGNILLDQAGEPYVCDFGLAKWIDDDRRLTVTAAVLGTPHYIAPEQANGKAGLTVAADIYSLGAILYELLTGRPPFVGETVIDTLRQASENTPARPSSIVRHTPRDLETICLKALEHDPNTRYRNAAAMADDLENWLAGRPIRARPVSAAEQLWRWARRNPLPATLGLVLLAALTAFAVGSTIAAVTINAARARAVSAEKDAQEQLYASLIAQARASRMTGQAGHRTEALKALRQAATIRPSLELRNEAIAALTLVDLEVKKKFAVRDNFRQALAFDALVRSVAVATQEGDIAIVSMEDGTTQKTLAGAGHPILALAHSGSRYVAARCTDGTVYVRDINSGELVSRFEKHPIPRQLGNFSSDCIFSSDETLLALGSPEGVEIVEVATGKEVARLRTPQPDYLAFDAVGKRVAFGYAAEKAVKVWRYAESSAVVDVSVPSEPRSLAWSSDQQKLAIGCSDFSICIVDARDWTNIGSLLGHRQEITKVTFNHRGDMLASAARDRTTRLWDLRIMTELVELPKYGSEPAITFSTDDRSIGATDARTSAAVISIVGLDRVCTAFPPAYAGEQVVPVSTVEFSADSRLLATASTKALQLFDARQARHLATVPIAPATQTSLRMLSDRTVAVLSRRTGLSFYDYTYSDGVLALGAAHHTGQFTGYVFGSSHTLPSPHFTLTSPSNAKVITLDGRSGNVVRELQDQHQPADFVVSPDLKWMVTSYRAQKAQLWDFPTGRPVGDLAGGQGGLVAFSPSGRWLACTGSGADHVLWKTGEWTPGPALPPQVEAETGRFAFSNDETLFTASLLEQIALVSLPEGELLAVLEQRLQPNLQSRVRLSPDNSRLAAQGADNSLSIWNLHQLQRELRELGLSW